MNPISIEECVVHTGYQCSYRQIHRRVYTVDGNNTVVDTFSQTKLQRSIFALTLSFSSSHLNISFFISAVVEFCYLLWSQ
jgi:hypothetical protein